MRKCNVIMLPQWHVTQLNSYRTKTETQHTKTQTSTTHNTTLMPHNESTHTHTHIQAQHNIDEQWGVSKACLSAQ